MMRRQSLGLLAAPFAARAPWPSDLTLEHLMPDRLTRGAGQLDRALL